MSHSQNDVFPLLSHLPKRDDCQQDLCPGQDLTTGVRDHARRASDPTCSRGRESQGEGEAGETEAWSGEATCPRSHRELVTGQIRA